MRLHMKPYRMFREAIDPLPGWRREPWEWLLAVAVMAACAWIFRAVGQAVFGLVIGPSLFR